MPDLPPDTWAPAPLRWRLVRPGDVFLDVQGRPWSVIAARLDEPVVHVEAAGAGQVRRAVRPADDPVPVLVPLVERATLALVRESGLAALVLDRTG